MGTMQLLYSKNALNRPQQQRLPGFYDVRCYFFLFSRPKSTHRPKFSVYSEFLFLKDPTATVKNVPDKQFHKIDLNPLQLS